MLEQVNLSCVNVFLVVAGVSTFENFTNLSYVNNIYMYNIALRQNTFACFHTMHTLILLVEKIEGMDVSGVHYKVDILPPLTNSRMRSQLISCQPIRDWQPKG